MAHSAEYSIWSVLRDKVYHSKIDDVDEHWTRLIDEWAQFDQLIVDAAISQWRRRLNAFVRVRGHTSSTNSDNFESNSRTGIQTYNSGDYHCKFVMICCEHFTEFSSIIQ